MSRQNAWTLPCSVAHPLPSSLLRGFATLVSSVIIFTSRVALLTPFSALQMGEVIALHEIEPSWNVHASFLKYHRTSALELDALRSSHPVQMICEDVSEDAVTQSLYVLTLLQPMTRWLTSHRLFSDAISYEKGSAVLKMLSQVIGEDAFICGT
jgi:hypothetical protein